MNIWPATIAISELADVCVTSIPNYFDFKFLVEALWNSDWNRYLFGK